jgi:hypothetical protein
MSRLWDMGIRAKREPYSTNKGKSKGAILGTRTRVPGIGKLTISWDKKMHRINARLACCSLHLHKKTSEVSRVMKAIWSAAFVLASVMVAHGEDKFQVKVVESGAMITANRIGSSAASSFAKVVLPSGDHANLYCSDSDGHCAKIESSAPEKMSPDATKCSTHGLETTCVTYDLGEFPATRKGNILTVEAPNGKLKFKIIGSW